MIRHQLLDVGLNPHEGLDSGLSLRRLEKGWGALIGSPGGNPGINVTKEYIPRLWERKHTEELIKVLEGMSCTYNVIECEIL